MKQERPLLNLPEELARTYNNTQAVWTRHGEYLGQDLAEINDFSFPYRGFLAGIGLALFDFLVIAPLYRQQYTVTWFMQEFLAGPLLEKGWYLLIGRSRREKFLP